MRDDRPTKLAPVSQSLDFAILQKQPKLRESNMDWTLPGGSGRVTPSISNVLSQTYNSSRLGTNGGDFNCGGETVRMINSKQSTANESIMETHDKFNKTIKQADDFTYADFAVTPSKRSHTRFQSNFNSCFNDPLTDTMNARLAPNISFIKPKKPKLAQHQTITNSGGKIKARDSTD